MNVVHASYVADLSEIGDAFVEHPIPKVISFTRVYSILIGKDVTFCSRCKESHQQSAISG